MSTTADRQMGTHDTPDMGGVNRSARMPRGTAIARVTRTREQARRSYDRLARWYDRIAGGAEDRYALEGLARLDVQPSEHVLEVGFGTGRTLLRLARQVGPDGHVDGIDLSSGMCSVARQRAERDGLAGRISIRRGDATQLPYQDETFDALFMSFTLDLFDTPEIPRVVEECYRVLRPDGRICVVSLAAREPRTLMTRLYLRAHAWLPQLVDCRPIRSADALHQAGFTIDGCEHRAMWGIPVDIVVAHRT